MTSPDITECFPVKQKSSLALFKSTYYAIINAFKRMYLSQELNQMFLDTKLQLNESV